MVKVKTFSSFLLFLGFFSNAPLVTADSLREYHQRMCDEGNHGSCQKAEAMLQGEYLADRIVKLGDNFALKVDRLKREVNNKPILKNAYIDVLDDYFKSSSRDEAKLSVNTEITTFCAEHYHDYWRNRKMWWPTQEDGKPDWSTIYYYIVDHYYGYCIALSNL